MPPVPLLPKRCRSRAPFPLRRHTPGRADWRASAPVLAINTRTSSHPLEEVPFHSFLFSFVVVAPLTHRPQLPFFFLFFVFFLAGGSSFGLPFSVLNRMAKARRRRVPAFGEWNYNYHHDEPVALPPAVVAPAACYATPEPESEACSDVWFRYSPPPRKPTPKKKHTSPRRPEGDMSRERSKASWDAAAAAKGGGSRRVVRPFDGDLYQVPPPEPAPHRGPRKTGGLWMGCLGLGSCVD